MGLFSSKRTTNVTENTTNVANFDNRIGASENARILGDGAAIDESVTVIDQSIRNDLSAEVASAAIRGAAELGQGAFGLINANLAEMAESDRQRRLLAESAISSVADSTRANLRDSIAAIRGVAGDSLEVVESGNRRLFDFAGATNRGILDLAAEIADRGQDESAAARTGAERTITEVLGFKEAGETKVAQDLIKWGGIAAAVVALALILRPRRA